MQSEILIPPTTMLATKSTSLPSGDILAEATHGTSRPLTSVSRRSLPTDMRDLLVVDSASIRSDLTLLSTKDDAFTLSCKEVYLSSRTVSRNPGNVLSSICSQIMSTANHNSARLTNRSDVKKMLSAAGAEFSRGKVPMKAVSNISGTCNTDKSSSSVGNTVVTSDTGCNAVVTSDVAMNTRGVNRQSSSPSSCVTPVRPAVETKEPVPALRHRSETSRTGGESVTKESQQDFRCETPPVPKGTTPLSHQVAGHIFGRKTGQKKSRHGFLQSNDGAILKPLQNGGRGERELLFYQIVFNKDCTISDLIKLRSFIPPYIDVWTTPEHPGMTYLKLRDLTKPFINPSIMDAKIGPITYDDEASEEKIRREKSKFPFLEQVGFQLVGIKVYRGADEGYETVERTFLRALDDKTILTEGLAAYFRPVPEPLRTRLLDAFIRRIDSIESWFMEQRTYRIIASSLLFVYDGQTLTDLSNVMPSDTVVTNPMTCCNSDSCLSSNEQEASIQNPADWLTNQSTPNSLEECQPSNQMQDCTTSNERDWLGCNVDGSDLNFTSVKQEPQSLRDSKVTHASHKRNNAEDMLCDCGTSHVECLDSLSRNSVKRSDDNCCSRELDTRHGSLSTTQRKSNPIGQCDATCLQVGTRKIAKSWKTLNGCTSDDSLVFGENCGSSSLSEKSGKLGVIEPSVCVAVSPVSEAGEMESETAPTAKSYRSCKNTGIVASAMLTSGECLKTTGQCCSGIDSRLPSHRREAGSAQLGADWSNDPSTRDDASESKPGCKVLRENTGAVRATVEEDCGTKMADVYDSDRMDSLVELRMIDFTHVFETEKEDENYLIGLRSLREHLLRLRLDV